MAKKANTAQPGAMMMAHAGNMKLSRPPAAGAMMMAHAGNMKVSRPTAVINALKKKKKTATKVNAKEKKVSEKEKLISSKVVYQGSLFRVLHDKLD